MRQPRSLDRLAVLLMLMLCSSWGLNQVAAKLALVEFGPITQCALRSAGGSLIVGAYAWIREPEVWRRDQTLAAGVLVGLLFALEFIVLFLAVQWTSAARAILFVFTAPFFVALGAVFFLPNERLRLMQWFGLALAFCGVAVGLLGQSRNDNMLGDLLAILAAAAWGATTIVIKASSLRCANPTKVLLYQIGISALVSPVVAYAAGERLPAIVSLVPALSLIYTTVWVVGVTYAIWFWLLGEYRAAELSAFTFLTPVVGVLAGRLILGDDLSAGFLVALALVAFGILLVNWPTSRSPDPAAPRGPG